MRKPSQARGVERRTQVLDAAIRVLARQGTHGVTHRAVAAEAGISPRATTYYFGSRKELLTEAFRHYIEGAIARFEDIRAPLPAQDPVAAAARMLTAVVVSDIELDRPGLIAEYELVLELSRDPTLEALYQEWQERLLSILIGYAEDQGAPDPRLHARILLATLRGLEIEALANPSVALDHDRLEQTFATLLHRLDVL